MIVLLTERIREEFDEAPGLQLTVAEGVASGRSTRRRAPMCSSGCSRQDFSSERPMAGIGVRQRPSTLLCIGFAPVNANKQ